MSRSLEDSNHHSELYILGMIKLRTLISVIFLKLFSTYKLLVPNSNPHKKLFAIWFEES